MKRVMIAGLAAGALLAAGATVRTAEAFPAGKIQAQGAGSLVAEVGRGGHGGHGSGHGGGHGHGPGHGGGGHGPGHGWGGNWGGHHGHGHGLRFYGYPFVGYGSYYFDRDGYGDECALLHRRARATGSRYWWARYEECVDDNY